MNEIIKRIFDYCESVLTGEIKACQKHKWAVKRFLNDYEDTADDQSLFYFDEEIVEDFYWFAHEFTHVEGVLAGQRIELTDFQLFISANIFGFRKKSNGARRFRKAYIQIARKNAKSQLLAIISAFITFFGDEKQRAFIAGWTRDQSTEVYEAVRDGIGSSELLDGKWHEAYGKINIKRNKSVIIPLSKEARKTGDGKNPSVGIVDEYHAHETTEIYDVLASGMVARREPLMFIITTAGYNLSRPCYRVYEYVSDVLDPNKDKDNDEYFIMICELEKDDDIKDESNWIKANPIVATYEEGLTSLRSDLKEAIDQPESMRKYLTKNMNIWVDKKEDGYMDMSKWKNQKIKVAFNPLSYPCYVGGDLSTTTDITSLGFVYVLGDGKYHVQQHSFVPEDKFLERINRDKFRFDLAVENELLTKTRGSVVDYDSVMEYLVQFRYEGHNLIEFDYDDWNATMLAQQLEKKGFKCVNIPQDIKYLNQPTKQFRSEVLAGNITHDDDMLLNWAIGNAITKQNSEENIKLDKKKSVDRIDPAAAVINAFARAMHHEQLDVSNHFTSGWTL